MKNIIFGLVVLFAVFSFGQSPIHLQKRIKQNFNTDWKFKLADSAVYETAEFDDSNWSHRTASRLECRTRF